MSKTIVATLLLLLSTTWVLAQETGKEASSSGQTTVQGCLSRSDSGYMVTDKTGTAYQLTGDTTQLSAQVGHEVQVKGKTEPSAAQPTISLSSIKQVSATCGSKSKSEKPPMTEQPPK